MAALSAQCSAVRTPELRVARRSTAARAPPPHARPVSALLSSRVALGGPALPARPRVSCRAPRPAAFAPAALFAQNKESVQWTTVVATVLSCVAFVVPLFLVPRPTLALVAQCLLGAVSVSLLLELLGDALRRRKLQTSGLQAAWLAKATAVAAAARKKFDDCQVSQEGCLVASVQPASWSDRNVAGAASEEDVALIRGMNEFLGAGDE